MSRPRLVLDTNVLLSALLFHSGAVAWLRGSWQSGAFTPLISRDTAAELLRVLTYPKFRLTEDNRQAILTDYLPWCETVTTTIPPPPIPQCRDPLDHPFLELAIAGRADALVTGDRDLLALTQEFPVSIVTPAQAGDMLARSPP
jgi:putative PIN family toxin of toxin-antitoxin system